MARVIGVACRIKGARPVVHAVAEVDEVVTELFTYSARTSDDLPLQLRSIQTTVQTELEHRSFEVAVVRLIDFDSRRSVSEELFKRFAAEGIVIAALRARCDSVRPLTGKEIGTTCASSKQAVLDEAATLVTTPYVEAAAALLAARRIQASYA